MLSQFCLNVAGLFLSTLGAVLMFFFPPIATQLTDKGEPLVPWVGAATPNGRRKARLQWWLSRGSVLLLLGGFLLQLGAAILYRAPAAPQREERVANVAPPTECATALSADECFDLLKRAGKNPFDAFDYLGPWPANEQPAPPCKNGAPTCKPWERDWANRHLEPGSVITERGTVVSPNVKH